MSTNLGRYITQQFSVSCRCVDLFSCSGFVACGNWADKHDENTGHIFATFVVNARYFIRVVSSSTPYDLCIITDNDLSVVNQASQA